MKCLELLFPKAESTKTSLILQQLTGLLVNLSTRQLPLHDYYC
ncbi:hypothetical protein [Prevotella melaninogenica]|nr:hypothetical protein [Prevotella melaninogenica]